MQLDVDRFTLGTVGDGVFEQVDHRLLQQRGVHRRRPIRRSNSQRHPHPLRRGFRGTIGQGRFEHRADRAAAEQVLALLALLLHPGQGQQVLENGVQTLGVLGDDPEELLPLLAVVHGAVQQRLDVALDGSDGRFQLVRDVGHELAADTFQPLQLA